MSSRHIIPVTEVTSCPTRHRDLISLDLLCLDEHKKGPPGINLNLTPTSSSSNISEKPDRYQEADRGSAFLFQAISNGNSN